jgi:hypothetical protein
MAVFKEISAKESTSFDYDVPSLEHDPSAEIYQQGLFSPLAELEEELLATYAGKVLTPDQIYHLAVPTRLQWVSKAREYTPRELRDEAGYR